ADSSENDAVRGADKYRLVARKGATAGTRYGKHRRTGREARLQRRENIKTVKGYQEKFKSEQYLQRTGKELPKAVRQQKRQQKRKQIRQYAEQKLGKNGKTIVDVGTRVMRFLAQAVRQAVGTVISFVAWPLLGAILIFLLLGGGFLLLFGLLSTTAATQLGSYTSDELDITEASQLATELEAKLEQQIAGIPAEWKWGHIDEFGYYVDPIGHDPFSLMAYLSAKRPGFDMALLSPIPHDVQQLHDNRYDLVLVEQVETRYRDVVYTDPITLIETTIQESYDYYKLNITLRSKSILAAVTPELAASSGREQLEHYNLLMETKGARQEFGNPFGAGVNWSGSVSSLYGYRIDPIGGKNLQQHRGLDLAAPIGTPIYAGISGKVRYIGYTSALGYYLILEDSKGVAMQYAHCSSLTVTEGEAVAVGDKLAVVARSGAGTSSHLHIEIKRNGKYLNPIYFLEC
ncbi:MAG: M23 family metallopeptidase, partial [Angelakisella sp.]